MASIENKSSVSENVGDITDTAVQASLTREDCDPSRGVVVQTLRSDTGGLADTHKANGQWIVNESDEKEMAQERLAELLEKIGGRSLMTPARLTHGGHSEMTATKPAGQGHVQTKQVGNGLGVKRKHPSQNCGAWYCGETCTRYRVSGWNIPQMCTTCNKYGHRTIDHEKWAKDNHDRDNLNESGASN